MSEFLQWISSGSFYANIFLTVLAFLLIIIVLIYLIAFIQGREISFWPPKIGIKPTTLSQNKTNISSKENPGTHKIDSKPANLKNIAIAAAAEKDCALLKISTADVKEFITQEFQNHPKMFMASFYLMPLVFLRYVLLLTWDGSVATTERILMREEAYPLNDAWSSCLALYRQATLLPYRTAAAGELIFTTDKKRTFVHYKKVIQSVKNYARLYVSVQKLEITGVGNLEILFDEAEFAVANENSSIAVTRLEAILSSIHKLLLSYPPQPSSQDRDAIVKQQFHKPKPMKESDFSVLVVDDKASWRNVLTIILESEGFHVQAVGTGIEAMQALIEHDYDLVITDMCLSDDDVLYQDGREVALVAKKANPKTRVVVISGYPGIITKAELLNYDNLLIKEKYPKDKLLKILKQVKEQKELDKDTD